MEPEKKIYKLDELNQMSHEALVEAYLILASYTMELLSRIMSMQDDYDALAESVRESESIFEQLAKMLPSLLTQLNRLEARVFGTHSTSYSNTVNKKLKRAKVLEIMQAIKERLMEINNDTTEKDKKKKQQGQQGQQGQEGQQGQDDGKEKPEPTPGGGTNGEDAEKKKRKHRDGNPNLVHMPADILKIVGGSLDHLIIKIDPIFRTEDELRRSLGVTEDLSGVSILSDAEFYYSVEYIMGNAYPCLHVSLKLKKNGGTIRNFHIGTIADQCHCSPSLGAMLITRRFDMAIPTARSEAHEFEYMGLKLRRSMAYHWMNMCADRYLKYVSALMLEKMMERDVLIFDETYGKTREEGRYYYWDCKTSENEDGEKLITFFYSRSHSAVIAKFISHGFKGYLVADGLDVYEVVACEESGIKLCNCWNHARVYLSDAFPGRETLEKIKNRGGSAYEDYELLDKAIDLITQMFLLDSQSKYGDKDYYATVRTREILPLAEKVFVNLKKIKERNSEYKYNSVLAEKVDYVLNREERLLRFKEDIRIPLSTNSLETQHSMVSLGRNNYFLFDTENGATTGSYCYTVMAKTRMDGVPAQDFCEFLLETLPVVLEMHQPEVLAFEKYNRKAMVMISNALEWQKAHPGKRAEVDFDTLGERPSLKFLEPYLCGNKSCWFDDWIKEKQARRKKLLAESANAINKMNLMESGLSADVLKRIATCGLNRKDIKDEVRKGLECLDRCLESFQADLEGTTSNPRFHQAYIREVGKADQEGQEAENEPEEGTAQGGTGSDGTPDPAGQPKSPDVQGGKRDDCGNDSTESDNGNEVESPVGGTDGNIPSPNHGTDGDTTAPGGIESFNTAGVMPDQPGPTMGLAGGSSDPTGTVLVRGSDNPVGETNATGPGEDDGICIRVGSQSFETFEPGPQNQSGMAAGPAMRENNAASTNPGMGVVDPVAEMGGYADPPGEGSDNDLCVPGGTEPFGGTAPDSGCSEPLGGNGGDPTKFGNDPTSTITGLGGDNTARGDDAPELGTDTGASDPGCSAPFVGTTTEPGQPDPLGGIGGGCANHVDTTANTVTGLGGDNTAWSNHNAGLGANTSASTTGRSEPFVGATTEPGQPEPPGGNGGGCANPVGTTTNTVTGLGGDNTSWSNHTTEPGANTDACTSGRSAPFVGTTPEPEPLGGNGGGCVNPGNTPVNTSTGMGGENPVCSNHALGLGADTSTCTCTCTCTCAPECSAPNVTPPGLGQPESLGGNGGEPVPLGNGKEDAEDRYRKPDNSTVHWVLTHMHSPP